MKIVFNPQKSNKETEINIENNILTYNGNEINLDEILIGATVGSDYIIIDKDLENNLEISLLWQYIDNNEINRFPKDLILEDNYNGKIKPIESTKE